MTEASWPFYGAETNETQFSKWARGLVENGIASGLQLTAGGGMTVNEAIGNAFVRGIYYENSTAAKSITISAAPGTAGQTRLDAIILKLDQTNNLITCVVKNGTANSTGGTLPTLQQDETIYELLIGTVSVANGVAAITNAMITELRPSVGERILITTTANKPTPAAAGEAIHFNTTTRKLSYSDGATWDDLMDVSHLTGILPVANGGSGVATLKLLREALNIYVQPTAPSHAAGRMWVPGTSLP